MRTRTRTPESAVAATERALRGPLRVSIIGAQRYWLEDRSGRQLGPESEGSAAPFEQALALVDAGANPEDLIVWTRLSGGERYRVAGGAFLIDLAQGAAGQPGKPRTPAAG
jgi:hypothetical protein